MTIGLLKSTTKVAVMAEVTEGTAVDPASEANFIQVLEGVEITPAKELIERQIIAAGKGAVLPRTGIKSAAGSLPLELTAGNVEGGDPQYSPVIHSMLGGKRTQATRITTGTTHTTSVINATAHGLSVGDPIIILEAGDHTRHFIQSTNTNDFTYTPARSGAPSDAVELAKFTAYFAEGTADEPTFTKTVYWGDEIKEQVSGCRAASMSLENFTTGQVPSLSFGYEALNFTETDASSGVTPLFATTALPPLALSVTLMKDGVEKKMNEFSMSVENSISVLKSVTEANGRINSRNASRAVSLNLTPYLDDSDIEFWTDFDDSNVFELVVWAGNDSATTGEFDLGSQIGMYFPSCIITGLTKSEEDGVLTRQVEVSANTGDGTETELFMGFC